MLPELTLLDYLTLPITELAQRPDFSRKAHAAALRLSSMSTSEIEGYIFPGGNNG